MRPLKHIVILFTHQRDTGHQSLAPWSSQAGYREERHVDNATMNSLGPTNSKTSLVRRPACAWSICKSRPRGEECLSHFFTKCPSHDQHSLATHHLAIDHATDTSMYAGCISSLGNRQRQFGIIVQSSLFTSPSAVCPSSFNFTSTFRT
jgi:hypothetical protein